MFSNRDFVIPSSIISDSVSPEIKSSIRNGFLNLLVFGIEGVNTRLNEILWCMQKVPSKDEVEAIKKVITKLPPYPRPLIPTYAHADLVLLIIERWGSRAKINQVFPNLSTHFSLSLSIWQILIQSQKLHFFVDIQDFSLIPQELKEFKSKLSSFVQFQQDLLLYHKSFVDIKENQLNAMITNSNDTKIFIVITLEKAFQLSQENQLNPSSSNFLQRLNVIISKEPSMNK